MSARAVELCEQLDEHAGIAVQRDVAVAMAVAQEHDALVVANDLDGGLEPGTYPVLAATGSGQDRPNIPYWPLLSDRVGSAGSSILVIFSMDVPPFGSRGHGRRAR